MVHFKFHKFQKNYFTWSYLLELFVVKMFISIEVLHVQVQLEQFFLNYPFVFVKWAISAWIFS